MSLPHQTRISAIRQIDSGLYLMYYDSTETKKVLTKSAIVEFDEYLALIEVPVVYDGGGAKNMIDHVEDAEVVMAALRERFPTKPLKYVLSSHWHPHSLSAVAPFISKGIILITTRRNFAKVQSHVDSTILQQYGENICYVDGDSLQIGDAHTRIVAYRLEKTTYSFLPTDDYLFFSLPQTQSLFCSCMYQRLGGSRVRGREMISGRTEDVAHFMTSRQLHPHSLLSFMTFDDEPDGTISVDTMHTFLQNGIGSYAIIDSLMSHTESTLLLKSDSLRDDILQARIPFAYLNMAVYRLLSRAELHKALALAQIAALLNPTDANAWDTFGEAYFFLGNTQAARYYERQSLRIDKNFNAGEKSWKSDLERHRTMWEEAGIVPK